MTTRIEIMDTHTELIKDVQQELTDLKENNDNFDILLGFRTSNFEFFMSILSKYKKSVESVNPNNKIMNYITDRMDDDADYAFMYKVDNFLSAVHEFDSSKNRQPNDIRSLINCITDMIDALGSILLLQIPHQDGGKIGVRHYVVVKSSRGSPGGRYSSNTGPAAAARKAATRRFGGASKLQITVRETGSDREYTYVARRVKLPKPFVRQIDGKSVTSEFKTNVVAVR